MAKWLNPNLNRITKLNNKKNMLKLLKKKLIDFGINNHQDNVTTKIQRYLVEVKTINEVIEEIHETFYTEVDRLLASAGILSSLETTKGDLIEKCNRLKALGFSNTKEVKEAEIEISRMRNLERENDIKNSLIEAINYFSFKYPNYKFITEESVSRISEKYNLVHGKIEDYIGTVPNKNLAQMEEFKIDKKDGCYIEFEMKSRRVVCSFETYIRRKEMYKGSCNRGISFEEATLEIVAPLKDFDMRNKQVIGGKISKIEIPDPVVLQPVMFGNDKYYLIVTAWGLEASDEIVVNHKMN